MSDTIKLSELLEEAVLSMLDASEEANENEAHKLSEQYMHQARALRAIAPALVRAVTEVCERHRNEDGESLHPVNGCAVCALAITLEEAGVTCD